MQEQGPIGIFDSGYGGLTVMKEIVNKLPQYDYLYLGDNARTPYGNRSFETVYEYTLQAVKWFFSKGCPLVVLACNTASAKALRSIQQKDLSVMNTSKRVLGVIRPTTEVIGNYSKTKHIGLLATSGTVASGSYKIETEKFFPEVKLFQQACPMWVPLVENDEYNNEGADYFIKKCLDQLLDQSALIDTILLACTHYPLLMDKIKANIPAGIKVISQGEIIADSLSDYLSRHFEVENKLSKNGGRDFYTTDSSVDFDRQAKKFYGTAVTSVQVHL
jgi:glutamate racemase